MICPECKIETYRKIQIGRTSDQVLRQLLNCRRCGIIEVPFASKEPVKKEKKVARASDGVLPKNPKKEELKKFLLKADEIKRTQMLKPSEKIKQAWKNKDLSTRQADLIERPISRVFMEGNSADLRSLRNMKVNRKHAANLGTENFRIIQDDGFQSVAERLN